MDKKNTTMISGGFRYILFSLFCYNVFIQKSIALLWYYRKDEKMRRYLDQELDELKLTTDNLEKIYQKILKRYGIDLKEVLDDKLSWEIVAQKIIEKNDIKSADVSVEMMRYKKINEQTLTLAGKWSGGTEKNRSNEIMKESLLDNKPISEAGVIELYNEIMKDENIREIHKKYFEMEFDEWEKEVNSVMLKYNVFQIDCMVESYLRLKYTQLSGERYNYIDGKRKGDFQVTGRVSDFKNLPVKNLSELPVFIKKLLDVIFTQKYIRIFDFDSFNKDKSRKTNEYADITRYSYEYINDMFMELENCTLENFYYLDYMLGVTLTNAIFNNVLAGSSFYVYDKERMKIQSAIFEEDFLKIIYLVSKMKGIYGRNLFAQMVFGFLFLKEFQKKEIDNIKFYVEKKLENYNHCYEDICDAYVWLCFYDIDQWEDEDKQALLFYLQNKLEKSVKDNLIDEGISAILEKTRGSETKNKRIKNTGQAKKPANLYAKIHMKVMEGIWE